jgi:hypothetical protein
MYTKRAVIVALALLLSVVTRAKPVPLGTVTSCHEAAIRGTNLVPGSTIFSGDTIAVGAQGNAWIAVLGGGQVQVSGNSTVRLNKSSDSIQLTVDRGQAQTNGSAIVVHRVSEADALFRNGARPDRDRHKERDCDVSRETRRITPCRDDSD